MLGTSPPNGGFNIGVSTPLLQSLLDNLRA